MLTGTALDLTPFGVVLQGIGIAYWLLVASVLVLVLMKVKGRLNKLLTVATVLGIMVVPMALHVAKTQKLEQQQAQLRQQEKTRLDAAIAWFEMRCKAAGEKISRTVDNVDGVVWMKWRQNIVSNQSDQFKLNDPYGQDCSLEGCILHLLRGKDVAATNKIEMKSRAYGYHFVETIDPRDGNRYRYTDSYRPITSATKEEFSKHVENTGYGAEPDGSYFALKRESIANFTARYGITWDDISTREDREKWIAGGSLKIVDLKTNETIAERIGYMMDRAQGDQSGFRSPWLFAVQNACPEFSHEANDSRRGRTLYETRDFVQKILHPVTQQGN
jgi:hypothetical protein